MIEIPAQTLAFISVPGGWEWMVVLIIAVLIFGRRLPDIARSFGKSITEFKKGVKDVNDEVQSSIDSAANEAEEKKEEQDSTS